MKKYQRITRNKTDNFLKAKKTETKKFLASLIKRQKINK